MRGLAAALICALGCRCGAPGAADAIADPPMQALSLDELGLDLLVPNGWTPSEERPALVLQGPAGSDAHYTTVSVQAVRARAPAPLDRWLKESYRQADALLDVRWGPLTPEVIDGVLALRYSVAFELQERARRRTGVVIELLPYLVDVSYTAPDELFGVSVGVFEQLLSDLRVEE